MHYNFSLFICSRKPKDGTEENTIVNGLKTYSHVSKDLASSFDQDANTESDKTIRIVVPNHMIPSDVPQDKHPNAAFSNNFIRYKQLQIT